MASKIQVPELKCLDPENYKKYFRVICWSGTRRSERRGQKRIGKKEKLRRLKWTNNLAVCYAPALLANPSQFAVYATVRKSVLSRWKYLQGPLADYSDDSDNDDASAPVTHAKLPKITGIGLRTVFSLISQARFTDANFCEQSLKALLDILQGYMPEELSQEPTETIQNLHSMLIEVASGSGPGGRSDDPTEMTALASSCLIALSVARGETELMLHAVASLVMANNVLNEQNIQVPLNLTSLQRSVQTVILGPPARNQWLNHGVPHQSLVTSFPIDLPIQLTTGSSDLVVRSLVSDGCFLYVFTSKGLLKIGSGYGSSIRQHVYYYKHNFFASDRHGWLGCCKNDLYVRLGRKKTEVYQIDRESLEVKNVMRLEVGEPSPVEPKCAVFSDGEQLGLIVLTHYDSLTIRMYDTECESSDRPEGPATLTSKKELNVPLLRKKTMILGRPSFDDGLSRRPVDLDSPVAIQLDDSEVDPLKGIYAGQDFALLTTTMGNIYYTGKGQSLGYKAANSPAGRWTLMKENIFTRSDAPSAKKCKVDQVAVGHEGIHAILVMDDGTALFTGVARRGEDGDSSKLRRTLKPSRPKKLFKADGYHISYAACNHGSTALVTKDGLLLMFGKDTQYCDPMGLVVGLRDEKVVQVALGKAHAAALTKMGQVFTFGINNKGQCGREFGYTKEKPYQPRSRSEMHGETTICSTIQLHEWSTDLCRVCVLCRQCTGFSTTCRMSHLPNRVPGEICGCGEGDSGCTICFVCRRCAETFAYVVRPDTVLDLDDGATSTSDCRDSKSDKDGRYQFDGAETERESGLKMNCLPPSRVAIPGGHSIAKVACGLHHTVLLTENGDVLTFGSNQFGQLGAGDISVHHRIVRVRMPKAAAIAAGSNHTVVLTRDGELYTFGSYQKGALGRPRLEETARSDRSPIWYATPGRVPKIGARYNCRAVWVMASGDQTFVQISESLINTETLFSSTITANNNCIVILPNRPEHAFKCITINKTDGTCNTWTGPEQVDFVNTLAYLDPLYDVLWCYQPQLRVMKCYNILAFDSHKLQRCCVNETESYDSEYDYPNFGNLRRLEDFKNLENFEVIFNNDERTRENLALTNTSVLNQELAIPCALNCSVTRMHGALHLLGCLDSLNYAHENKINQGDCRRDYHTSSAASEKEDYFTVNRFESHGGGWGYSGLSVEAIRFMCDSDIVLGGYGLFGGRGDYSARIKLFDIGNDGGDQEGDGILIAESDEVVYECAPRDKFPIMFDPPVPLMPNRWYVAWACINGPSSDCGSSGQAMVINDEIGFHFKTSKKSNNGTDVNAGQIPSLLYNLVDQSVPVKFPEPAEPVNMISKNISRKVTVACFQSLINLLQWSWNTFKDILLETNGQVAINYQKLNMMKHQKRLVYVIRACLRLTKSYVNEIYPQASKKRNTVEYMKYFESIADCRNLIQLILSDTTPTCSMLPKKPGKNKTHRICYVQFALEMTNSILQEAHETITSCYHAFFPTPTLKWTHLCSMLVYVKEGNVLSSHTRELTACCAAMCGSRSLRDVLQYMVSVTQGSLLAESRRPDSKIIHFKDVPSKSATVPRSSTKPPPIPPRLNQREHRAVEADARSYTDWHLLDVIPKLLDIVTLPIKHMMMTRPCGQPHDHGEIKQNEKLSEFCCKLVTRIIAELSHSAVNVKEEIDTSTVTHLVTPSRFMRVNQTRAWNTGNGSPDAICFTIDKPGIMLVGVNVYVGMGNYEYSLELLHDVRIRSGGEETNPANCWVSLEIVNGSYAAVEVQHDIIPIKFERPVSLKEDLRYAIRFCNHGARTANGDCGLPSVEGPDGTSFRFVSCSLSFNGTTQTRGQIPSLIYYSTSRSSLSSESSDNMVSALRNITLRVAFVIIERSSELFCSLRNELTSEDLRRNASVLQRSPAINVLVPYTLASLERLIDSKSVIKILEMVHTLLPHVAAMNTLMPANEEVVPITNYYTWVESEHPYREATVTNIRVLFPTNVAWIVLEMDPRSVTAQPEDSLTVFAVAGVPFSKCHCTSNSKTVEAPFRKVYKRLVHLSTESTEVEELYDDADVEPSCTHYNCTYVSVTPKMANVQSEYPQRALLVPGNEVIFSLETGSDYLKEYNKSQSGDDNRFGFRCLCVGYEDAPYTTQKQGLTSLEMELIYAGAACASRLLAPDLDIPPLAFSTIVEVQVLAMMGSSPASADVDSADYSEALLLSRGLELSSPPTIHQVLDGQPLLRSATTERQFLSDFVAGAESTAGGRLAQWLAPISRVEPSKCELKAPVAPARPSAKLSLPIILRDQFGEAVSSPEIKVEVVVQKIEEGPRKHRASLNENRGVIPDDPYNPTVRDTITFHAISMMKIYQNYSFEELRLASGQWGEFSSGAVNVVPTSLVPAERLLIKSQPDGSYVAVWTPRAPGIYMFRCSLDDHPAPQELTIEVAESALDCIEEFNPLFGVLPSTPPTRILRFVAKCSAGLRVRASPSLQAEELGRVPPGAKVAYVEEVVNKDGTWVRLSKESMKAFTEVGTGVGWCLEHHRQLDRELLVPLDPTSPLQAEGFSSWDGFQLRGHLHNWVSGEDIDDTIEVSNLDDKRFQLPSMDADESDSSSSPFVFGSEPSKRSRIARNESAPSSPRMQRRSNGNSDEWLSPEKQRSIEDLHVNIIEVGEIGEACADSGGAGKSAQAGTQTSPDTAAEGGSRQPARAVPRARTPAHVAAPLPVRAAPAPPPPKKHALSPAQAECLRAIFAALLWHEGIVHDAIACAAFLKFHPQLPKQGARVITRGHQDVARHQRHSVEVASAGQYLSIQQSTLDTLSRSGATAFASRLRKNDIDQPIKEEDMQPHTSESAAAPSPSVVNVLPPALRALVALWDALYDSDQLSAATDKLKKPVVETNENEEIKPLGALRKKRDWKTSTGIRTPYSVKCDLCCGSNVPPPLAAHMRHAHPGCRVETACGYDRAGVYRIAPPRPHAVCGQLSQGQQLWYILCGKCRELSIKASASARRPKTKSSAGFERMPPLPEIDHYVMRENAVFLLDLAPLTNSESTSTSSWQDSRSPPTPPGSIWLPAPPFQCLQALGEAPKASASDATRYHSLGRPPLPALAPLGAQFGSSESASGSQLPRVHRSVSMGQASGSRDLAHAARAPLRNLHDDDQDTLSGAGLSLLSQPSAALQKLVSGGEWTSESCTVSAFEPPHFDPGALMRSSVLTFVLARRDLHSYRQKMDAAVRINTVRQYAFEALNWLLRSTTQPTSTHDVMWWFCTALDRFARIVQPPLSLEDKDNPLLTDLRTPTPSVSAICPGGRSARNCRAAFHKLLGSVSALAASLHPSSPSALQAVRCWAAHYSPHDRAFLHRSQVFNVISKILSHPEDGIYDDNVLGALHESFHSYLNKENYVWTCPDVTGWCDIAVSSRQGMAGALTDGSTETFWESGDEDRNKVKWVQISYPGGSIEDRPHIVCVHVDNSRDTASKTMLATFLFSSGTSEVFHRHDTQVDLKSASWLCYTLPRVSCESVRVRVELRGPEASVRVRQVRVLSAPTATPSSPVSTPARVLHALCETDTLRVFKLLTSQVFGKLLEWERTGSDSGGEGATVDDAAADDSDLREHVVGILFAGHKLTSLQKQVMTHIVCAVGYEAARVRDDWETLLLCADSNDELPKNLHLQDNCCFEMLSLLLALSGSSVGRVHLAQRTEILSDLLVLLHTGSERVQRQVITLLRRIIAEIPPQKMLAAVNYGNEINARVTLLDHLVSYVSKAITVQLKVKGAGTTPTMVEMGTSIHPAPPASWFMRGETTKKHAHLVAKLLGDMAEDKISAAWGLETRNALAGYARQVSQTLEQDRRPARCIAQPTIWLSLAALCICDQAHIDLMNNRDTRRDSSTDRPFCTNHDDGATVAVIDCKTCGALCAECDRCLHLNRAARAHHRQICKEEESAIRIDIHEGCGRAKLFWLLLLVDRKTLKGLAEFRGMEGGVGETADGATVGPLSLAGMCRYCGTRGNTGLLAIGNVCADQQCQEHSRDGCNRVLTCGHACNGVRGEPSCLPCLFGCTAKEGAPLRQDADDMCMICFTDPLQAAPALQLKCGHVFHLHCCKKVLANKWNGPRITFSFSQCPICKEDMDHWTLEELLAPIRRLREEVMKKAAMRLEYEGAGAAGGAQAQAQPDPAAFAMDKYAYYVCHKCEKAYFGGLARCEAESSGSWEAAELVCGACSDVTGARTCPKHGADFLEYKCRYCCSVAVFFCFGTSHFCNSCHDDFQRVTNMQKDQLPQCPAGPKGEQLPGTAEECPLHVQHPPTGEEFALGCGVCRNAHAF